MIGTICGRRPITLPKSMIFQKIYQPLNIRLKIKLKDWLKDKITYQNLLQSKYINKINNFMHSKLIIIEKRNSPYLQADDKQELNNN